MKFESLYALGTNGWIPGPDRQTMCFMIKTDSRIIFLDAGTGLSRLLSKKLREIIASFDEIVIILSHYHYDHIVGLGYLPLFFEGKKVCIYGPGPDLSGFRAREILDSTFSSPNFSLPLDKFPMDLEVLDLRPGINYLEEGLIVKAIKQKHSDPSTGIRLNDNIAYITDTPCSEQTVEFANNCGLLLHEAYYDNKDFATLVEKEGIDVATSDHAFSLGVAEIALKAKVTRAYLIHLNPEYNEERLLEMEKEAQRIFHNIHVPHDLEEIPIN